MPSNDTVLEEERNTDAVHSILTGIPFKIRPDDEKLEILKKGRPLYYLNNIKRYSSRNCNILFHSYWYNIHKWLCGSESYNKLFCWPCLLMRPETSSWCSIGNDDLKRFTTLAAKHARCKSHLQAICEYDKTLSNFGLPPEFVNELQIKLKEVEAEAEEEGEVEGEGEGEDREETMSNKDNEGDNCENLHFKNTKEKEHAGNDTCTYRVKQNENQDAPKIHGKITFKTWLEMCENNFPVSKSKFLENFYLYKWKKKIAKQELRNAKLAGEKLQFEIEVLKAKVDYYKGLKQDTKVRDTQEVSSVNNSAASLDAQCKMREVRKI